MSEVKHNTSYKNGTGGFLHPDSSHAPHASIMQSLSANQHVHADHYGGITDNWERGPIYCSPITGRLVVHMLGIKPEYVHELPMDTPCVLQGANPPHNLTVAQGMQILCITQL